MFFEHSVVLFLSTTYYSLLLNTLIILKVADFMLLYIPFISDFINLLHTLGLSFKLPPVIDLGLFVMYFTEEALTSELQDITKQIASKTIDNFYNTIITGEHYWSNNIFIAYPLNHLYF